MTGPFSPGFYTQTRRLAREDLSRRFTVLAERWQDEASEAALAGNPRRAQYLEGWARFAETQAALAGVGA